MTYVIPTGAFKGKAVTELDTAFLRVAVERHIQPKDFYDACLTELLARGEPMPAGSKANPDAFVLPAERPIVRIPDSLAEISAAARAGPVSPPASQASAFPGASAPQPGRAERQRPSAGESIPMPCGHATSDLGWTDDGHTASACMACLNLRAAVDLLRRDGGHLFIPDVIRLVEREARRPGWPHQTSDEWRSSLGKPDEAA